ncbi:hypothetical protein VPH35_064931 [Triticum aestivum]
MDRQRSTRKACVGGTPVPPVAFASSPFHFVFLYIIKGGEWNFGLLATLLLYKADPAPPHLIVKRQADQTHTHYKAKGQATLLKPQATNAAPRKNPSLLPPTDPSLRSSSSPATTCSHGNGLQDGDGGDEHQGGVQAVVHGDEVEEGAPLRGVQDRRADARRAGGQGGRPRGGVRRARRRAARRRLPLRRLRLRLRLRRQLPEEQDLLHRMVILRLDPSLNSTHSLLLVCSPPNRVKSWRLISVISHTDYEL